MVNYVMERPYLADIPFSRPQMMETMNDAHKFIILTVYYDRYLNLINIFDYLHVKSSLALHWIWIQHKKDTDRICAILIATSVYAEWQENGMRILFEKDVVIISWVNFWIGLTSLPSLVPHKEYCLLFSG